MRSASHNVSQIIRNQNGCRISKKVYNKEKNVHRIELIEVNFSVIASGITQYRLLVCQSYCYDSETLINLAQFGDTYEIIKYF